MHAKMISLLDSWAENAEPLVCCIEAIYQAGDIPAGRGNIPRIAVRPRAFGRTLICKLGLALQAVRQPGTPDFKNWAALSLITNLAEGHIMM